MKKEINSAKGITLIALIVTIIVILILASVGTYSGIEAVKTAQLNKFISEMKIMQVQVNNIYDKYKNGEEVLEYRDEEILNNIGKTVSTSSKADSVFSSEASGITDNSGYRYFNIETINSLGIEGVEEEFFVNIEKRSIISVNGFEYNGKTYYTMDQIPSSLYNVDYEEKSSENPKFEINCELSGENKYKIKIVPEYDVNIEKWQVKYKLSEESNWNTSDNLEFEIEKAGKYQIQIQNGDIKSDMQEPYLGYITDGLMVHYDGIINTRNGSNKSQEINEWQDLSGKRNDGNIRAGCTWEKNCLNFDGVSGYVSMGVQNYSNVTLEVVVLNNELNESEKEIDYIANYENGGYALSAMKYNGRTSFTNAFEIYTTTYKRQYANNTTKKNKIYSLSGSYNSQIISLYQNGLKTTTELSGSMKSAEKNTSLCLGTNPSADVGKSQWLNGKIYSVRIYNRALTDDEVQVNYKLDASRFNIE